MGVDCGDGGVGVGVPSHCWTDVPLVVHSKHFYGMTHAFLLVDDLKE